MKKYDSYKDSGVEWVGDIPSHWEIKRGKDILKFTNGFPFESSLFSMNEVDGFPLVRIRDLKSEKLTTFYKGQVVEEAIIENNDFIIGMDGDFNIVKWNKGRALLNQRLCKVEGINGLQTNYLSYSLPYYLKIINDLTYFTTVKHLSNGDLNNQKYLVPTFEEQIIIANHLDHKTTQIDNLIAKKVKFIKLLEEERVAVINHAVTKGLDPNVPMKGSGIEWLGEIPEHWEIKKLKYVCSLISNKAKTKPRFVLALENIESWTGEIVGDPYSNSMESEVQLFQEGDILFNKLRPYLAKVCLVKQEGGAIGELLVLRPSEFINSGFLFQRLRSEMIITIVDGSTYGTKMPRASWEKFISQLEIGIPPIDEQTKIEKFIINNEIRIRELATKTKQEIDLLKEYKTALISDVVTGKVDVRSEQLN
jgi:restriction endonuclease S subunit